MWVEGVEGDVLKIPAWSTDLERCAYKDCQSKLGIFSFERLLNLEELVTALCFNVPNFSVEIDTQPGSADETGQSQPGTAHHGPRLGDCKPASCDMGQINSQNTRNGGHR